MLVPVVDVRVMNSAISLKEPVVAEEKWRLSWVTVYVVIGAPGKRTKPAADVSVRASPSAFRKLKPSVSER